MKLYSNLFMNSLCACVRTPPQISWLGHPKKQNVCINTARWYRHLRRPLPRSSTENPASHPPLRAMSVVYSRRLKKELQEIQIEQADPAKRAAGASCPNRLPPPPSPVL